MPKALKLYVTGLVISSALALVVTSLVFAGKPGYILGMTPEISAVQPPSEVGVAVGLLFWTVMTLFASALPVRMPRGTIVSVSFATVVAAMILGGPVAAGWVAAIGTTEIRELRGRVPWYGVLFNHAAIVLPALVGGLVFAAVRGGSTEPAVTFIATMFGAAIYFALNVVLTATGVSLRDGLGFQARSAGGYSSVSGEPLRLGSTSLAHVPDLPPAQ